MLTAKEARMYVLRKRPGTRCRMSKDRTFYLVITRGNTPLCTPTYSRTMAWQKAAEAVGAKKVKS